MEGSTDQSFFRKAKTFKKQIKIINIAHEKKKKTEKLLLVWQEIISDLIFIKWQENSDRLMNEKVRKYRQQILITLSKSLATKSNRAIG